MGAIPISSFSQDLCLVEVILMYRDLTDLLQKSTSTRNYFLTLPLWLQMRLHKEHNYIRTAAKLHHVSGILMDQKNLL